MESYYQKNREKLAAGQRRYYWERGGKEKQRLRQQKRYHRIRCEVLGHYSSNGIPQCNQCGIMDIDVLCIDHINGGGNKHRASLGGNIRGVVFYQWLQKRGYPEGYQTLCCNCNQKEATRRQREKGIIWQ